MDVDLANGPQFDLRDDAAWLGLTHRLRAGEFVAIIAGPPCTTFSRARTGPPGPRPLRSPDHPYGLPRGALSPADNAAVAEGTYLALRTLEFLSEAQQRGVAWALESPEPTGHVLWARQPLPARARPRVLVVRTQRPRGFHVLAAARETQAAVMPSAHH